jgi:hypothetical protein
MQHEWAELFEKLADFLGRGSDTEHHLTIGLCANRR